MFENYSLADLCANIYKKWKLNAVLFIVLSMLIAVPLLMRSLNTPVTQTVKTNTSTTLFYRIDVPENQQSLSDKSAKYGGYSDFYYYLVQNNINGAFLFDNVDDATLNQIAAELGIATQTLKNSNFELWDNKLVVSTLSENRGIAVKILTTSKTFNDLVENKINDLITKYQNVYDNVTITRVDPVSAGMSHDMIQAGSRVSLRQLAVRVVAAMIVAAFVVVFLNMARYLFNPTVNRVGDLAKYGLSYVYEIDTVANALAVIRVNQAHADERISFVSSSDKILAQLKQSLAEQAGQYQFIEAQDVAQLADAEAIVLVEAFGTTRYHALEQRLNVIASVNKEVQGAIAYKL